MDTVTLAIISALAKLSESVIKDGYEALKATITRKYGKKSDLTLAIENVEKKPDSPGRKETLKEEISVAKVNDDPEILKLAEVIIKNIQEIPGGKNIVSQTVTGNQNIFSGTGNVSINESPKSKQRKR